MAAILLNVSGISVAGQNCLYKQQAKLKPVGIVAEVHGSEFSSYLLKNGSYLHINLWSCSRLGRRLLIVVPQKEDTAHGVIKVSMPLVDNELREWLKKSIMDSFGEENYEREYEVEGYEAVKLSVSRDMFSATYIISYYTSD